MSKVIDKYWGVSAEEMHLCNEVKNQDWCSDRWERNKKFAGNRANPDPESFTEKNLLGKATYEYGDGIFAGIVIDKIVQALNRLSLCFQLSFIHRETVEISHNSTKLQSIISISSRVHNVLDMSAEISTLLSAHMKLLARFNPQKMVCYFVDFGHSLERIIDGRPFHTNFDAMTTEEERDFNRRNRPAIDTSLMWKNFFELRYD